MLGRARVAHDVIAHSDNEDDDEARERWRKEGQTLPCPRCNQKLTVKAGQRQFGCPLCRGVFETADRRYVSELPCRGGEGGGAFGSAGNAQSKASMYGLVRGGLAASGADSGVEEEDDEDEQGGGAFGTAGNSTRKVTITRDRNSKRKASVDGLLAASGVEHSAEQQQGAEAGANPPETPSETPSAKPSAKQRRGEEGQEEQGHAGGAGTRRGGATAGGASAEAVQEMVAQVGLGPGPEIRNGKLGTRDPRHDTGNPDSET